MTDNNHDALVLTDDECELAAFVLYAHFYRDTHLTSSKSRLLWAQLKNHEKAVFWRMADGVMKAVRKDRKSKAVQTRRQKVSDLKVKLKEDAKKRRQQAAEKSLAEMQAWREKQAAKKHAQLPSLDSRTIKP